MYVSDHKHVYQPISCLNGMFRIGVLAYMCQKALRTPKSQLKNALFSLLTDRKSHNAVEFEKAKAINRDNYIMKSEKITSHWRHNDHDGVSSHQPHGYLLNRLSRRRSYKTSKLRVTGLCVGNSPGPVNSLHKGPVTWKMFPFDDVIMNGE